MPKFIVKLKATIERDTGEDSDRQFDERARFDTAAEVKAWIDDRFAQARGRARLAGIDIHVRVVRDEDYTQAFKDQFDAGGLKKPA